MSFGWVKFGKFVDVTPDQTFFKGNPAFPMPDHRRYREWLNSNVGRESQDWIQQSKRNAQGFVAYRYRFKRDDDALMFKLTFNENIHV
jgi:hypothetical protein